MNKGAEEHTELVSTLPCLHAVALPHDVMPSPRVADSAETPYILSFAIIMLNTDLHRANNGAGKRRRRRMTKEEFINNLRWGT